MRPQRALALACTALAVSIAPAPPASADFHLVSIREVFPGAAGQPGAEYVQFQAYAAGQNFIAGHSVTFHDAGGATIATETFGSNVASGRNQMTFVLATPEAESRFGILADEEMAASLMEPAGGAVCWASLDCVSWGSFGGSLPSAAGPPAAPGGIPDEMALRRTIAPGCATLLEAGDDRDSSALDFFAVFPAPRPNSVAPSERACTPGSGSGPGPGGGGSGAGAPAVGRKGRPQTILRGAPAKRTRDRTPTFRFASSEPGSRFECKLDGRPFRGCRSPFTARRLALRTHTFKVRARSGGAVDGSPASYSFTVVARRPR